jgi:hypothetical protein
LQTPQNKLFFHETSIRYVKKEIGNLTLSMTEAFPKTPSPKKENWKLTG